MGKEIIPPDVHSYSLDEFFAKTYVVPAYQRNYAWTSKEVTELLDDVLGFFDDSKAPYYLLGDVIVVDAKEADYDLEIIDGQQRITTLMLLFASIYKRLKDNNFDEDELSEIRLKLKKRKVLRVRLSGNASDTVLQYIDGVKTETLSLETPSQKAVADALDTISSKLDEKFSERKSGYLHDFYRTLEEQVFLSRLQLVDRESAYEFFERVNDRGRPLSKTDLLKNRLLQKIRSDDDFDNASDVWSSAEKRLLPFGREGSMPFLLRNILQADTKRRVKDSELYTEWKPFVTDDASCLKLIDRIEVKAKHLANLLGGLTPGGLPEVNSTGTTFLKFTQNYGVKLAGGELSTEVYDLLSQRLEARALLSLFALERSQTYENQVVGWQHSVSKLKQDATAKDVIKAVDLDSRDLDDLFDRAKVVLKGLRYGKTPGQTAKIRLLLAIVNYELLQKAPKYHTSLQDFLMTSKKVRGKNHPGYDIEHIGATSTASERLGDLVDSVGNLTLFYSTDNRSQGAADIEFKAADYGKSICYATKILTSSQDQDEDVEAVLSPLRVTTVDDGTWGSGEIDLRFDFYWKILEERLRRDLEPSPED